MMQDEALLETAIIWHVRMATNKASDRDWAAFTDWLETDPENALAYDRVAFADEAYGETFAEIPTLSLINPQNDNETAPWYRRKTLMALAVSVAIALFAAPLLLNSRDMQTFETKAGEMREISLGDGSQIALNGATRVEVDRKDRRFARLSRGEALFSIKHDAQLPFTLEIDSHKVVDVGTQFNVRKGNDSLEIAVSEGAVQFNPNSDALLVKAGNQVNIATNRGKAVLTNTNPANVGGWRTGRLSYRDAPVSRIATDLARLIGEPVTVENNVQDKRFSGLIQIGKDRKASMHRLESLLGIKAQHGSHGWVLSD